MRHRAKRIMNKYYLRGMYSGFYNCDFFPEKRGLTIISIDSIKSDCENLSDDWFNIGSDIKKSLYTVGEE
jgi:hypothetical protein